MYTVRLAIRTSPYDEQYLNKCFYYGWQISNQIRRRVITSLDLLTSMKDYQIARRQYVDSSPRLKSGGGVNKAIKKCEPSSHFIRP